MKKNYRTIVILQAVAAFCWFASSAIWAWLHRPLLLGLSMSLTVIYAALAALNFFMWMDS